jgi:chromosomal replication initiation ATPase DnaA
MRARTRRNFNNDCSIMKSLLYQSRPMVECREEDDRKQGQVGIRSGETGQIEAELARLEAALGEVRARGETHRAAEAARCAFIIEVCVEVFRLEPGAIQSRDRSEPTSTARQLAMTLLRERGHSFPSIARVFQRDHATIKHAIRAIEAKKADRTFGPMIERAIFEIARVQ